MNRNNNNGNLLFLFPGTTLKIEMLESVLLKKYLITV